MKYIAQGIYKLMNKTGYPSYDGFEIVSDTANNGAHGVQTPAEFILNLREEATVVVEGCAYGSGEVKAFQENGERKVTTCRGLSAIRANDKEVTYYRITGVKKGELKITITGTEYIHGLVVTYDKGIYDHDQVEVIDFGAAVFEEKSGNDKIKHHLTSEVINGWYDENIERGLSGVEAPSSFFCTDEKGDQILYHDSNNKTDNRIRSKNQSLTRFDDKAPKDIHGIVYPGYFYSNTVGSPAVYLAVSADEGDRITAYTTSNALDSTIHFVNMSDPADAQVQEYTGGGKIVPMVFYAKNNGMYKQYSTTEKLAVARYVIEHAVWAKVTGKITASDNIPQGYELVFTNDQSGAVYMTVPLDDGSYEISLPAGLNYTYTVSLSGANGFVVQGQNRLELLDRVVEASFDIRIRAVELAKVTGFIKGLDEESLKKVIFITEALEDVLYVPQISINRESGSFVAEYEVGVSYEIKACGVDDFRLTIGDDESDGKSHDVGKGSVSFGSGYQEKDSLTVKYTEDKAEDMVFVKKTLHTVGIESDIPRRYLESMSFEFIHLNSKFEPEEDYKYVFAGPEGIRLRDGQYKVKVFVSEGVSASSGNESAVAESENGVSASADSKNAAETERVSAGTKISADAEDVSAGTKDPADVSDISKYVQLLTPDLKVTGADTFLTIEFEDTTLAPPVIPYKEILTVGRHEEYRHINEALDAIRHMDRADDGGQVKPVTVSIEPGDYEEMLVIDIPNVTFVNASGADASTALKNKGVDIDETAVRITFYYGHGYTYYSMADNCKFDERLLWVNSHNGYPTFVNPGSGINDGGYWNATVVVAADNVQMKGIILENSFNQYISKMAARDVIVPQSVAKEGKFPRTELSCGSTFVQKKEYVERAAALAMCDDLSGIYFENCRIISRQDTLYGGQRTKAAFNRCAIYGSTDYIFGAMTAVFKDCELVANTEPQNSADTFYITAVQQFKGRGFLFLDCHVTSCTPGEDTCFEGRPNQGYFGRPWLGRTSEAVFFGTKIDATDRPVNRDMLNEDGECSLITAEGWKNTLGGESEFMYEFGTLEAAKVDNSERRAVWANPYAVEEDAYIAAEEEDGTLSTDKKVKLTRENAVSLFLGVWDPFA